MRVQTLIWYVWKAWAILMLLGFLSSLSPWPRLGAELIASLGPRLLNLVFEVYFFLFNIGIDVPRLTWAYAKFSPNHNGTGLGVPPVNAFDPGFTSALLFFGTWIGIGAVVSGTVSFAVGLIPWPQPTPSAYVSSSSVQPDHFGDRVMVLFLAGLVAAAAIQYLTGLTWLSGIVLLLASGLALQRYLNRQRLERFKVAELVQLVTGLRNESRTEIAMVAARINNELSEQNRLTGKLWVSAPASIPLSVVAQVVSDTQAHVDKAHEPREQLALELERWRVQNQYEYARHVREIKRLAIENQQQRWELITREVTELRKVMVAATEEVARNPALQMRLQDMFMHVTEFQRFMENLKAEGRIADSKAGQMMDELFSRTFEAQVDELLKPNRSNGAGAASRH